MRGALAGAVIVGLMRALAIRYYAELEILAIYCGRDRGPDRASRRPAREADRMRLALHHRHHRRPRRGPKFASPY
jgi:hypothetical protein